MYNIRRCNICFQELHIKKRGRYIYIKNNCGHIPSDKLSRKTLETYVVPLSAYVDTLGYTTINGFINQLKNKGKREGSYATTQKNA